MVHVIFSVKQRGINRLNSLREYQLEVKRLSGKQEGVGYAKSVSPSVKSALDLYNLNVRNANIQTLFYLLQDYLSTLNLIIYKEA